MIEFLRVITTSVMGNFHIGTCIYSKDGDSYFLVILLRVGYFGVFHKLLERFPCIYLLIQQVLYLQLWKSIFKTFIFYQYRRNY